MDSNERRQNITGSNHIDYVPETEDLMANSEGTVELLYKVEDNPPLPVTVVSAIQVAATNVSVCVTMAVLTGGVVCADSEMITKLTSANLVMSGISTILQTTFGVRLPIFQGPNSGFLVPVLNMAQFPGWSCHKLSADGINLTDQQNNSSIVQENEDLSSTTRIRMFQGGLLVASVIHMVLGGSGLMGRLRRYIGPLTIAPTIGLIGFVMISSVITLASTHWGISFCTLLMFLVMSVYLEGVRIPIPVWTRDKGCHLTPYPIFQVYAIVLALAFGWLLSWILTCAGALTDDPDVHGYTARTDARVEAIHRSRWFNFPYPGQFGGPIFSVSIFTGMLLTVIMSIVESIGDYITAATICGVRRPPFHAINRGLFAEGFASVISALLGTANGTTSYSGMIGFIGLTKVGSRLVFQLGGLILIILGLCGKMSALFVMMPDAVIGGATIMFMASITGVALSSLHSVNLKLTRNFITLGLSLILGILVPQAIQGNPKAIDTGLKSLDQVLVALLTNGPCLGGFVGFFLDNTLPGKRSQYQESKTTNEDHVTDNKDPDVYDLPWIPRRVFMRQWTRYVPFFPRY